MNVDLGSMPGTEDLQTLVRRAESGDQYSLPALREFLDTTPALWQEAGDLARRAEDAQIALAAGQNLMLRESLTRKMATLKESLSRTASTPLERMIIERIVISWLQAAHADIVLAQVGTASAEHVKALQRRVDRTQRNLLRAIKDLATVRKLLR